MPFLDDDCLLEICRFLMREHVEHLELVCAHWHRLFLEYSRSLPRRPLNGLVVYSLTNKLWPFYTIADSGPISDNWENMQSQQIINLLIAQQQTQKEQQNYIMLYTLKKAIHQTNRLFWCRICGQTIKPFAGGNGSKYSRAKFADASTYWSNSSMENEFCKMMAHHFKMHMQEVHQKFYSTIRNLEEIEKLDIPFYIGLSIVVEPYSMYKIAFNLKKSDLQYHQHCRNAKSFGFLGFFNNSPESLSHLLQSFTNCHIAWCRFEVSTLRIWRQLCALLNLVQMSAKELNFTTETLSISFIAPEIENLNNTSSAGSSSIISNGFESFSGIKLSAFLASIVQIFALQQLFTYIPMEDAKEQWINGLIESDVFPDKCRHIDIQPIQNDRGMRIGRDPMLKLLIFKNYSSYKKEQWLELRRIWYGDINANKHEQKFQTYRYDESGTSSLSFFPLWPNFEFIEDCLEHFLSLTSTDHLRGRWIQFSNTLTSPVDSFEARNDRHNLNIELHDALKPHLLAMPALKCVKTGEYLATNARTGDQICLLFTNHRDCKEHEKEGCPYKHAFVLELTYPIIAPKKTDCIIT